MEYGLARIMDVACGLPAVTGKANAPFRRLLAFLISEANEGGSMKLLTVQSTTLTILLCATPVMAQSSDQAVNEGAGVIAWIVVGLIGGYLASRVVNKTGEGVIRDILLGIVGGIVGGILFRVLGGHGVTGFNLWSILVAFVGGVVVLLIYHTVRGQRAA
jgi:uncharacterized membrane protein YeaQ/YmgE (transglycosylase-associated protein family)